ncbi:hypothetical protein VC83_07935 [Pseudogymnoascus destructans]|uniref:Uncharacterized protein n=2 Tax=Pseudogymnoascus destructans TaxID=655981 RepID=L8GB79_PSED2|nr:uncharacterized protein VC83_07935 [Pseudogymnoascus destructans]ELR10337.1 hypothetical protein GMDG_04719 [Pseudogymnoascus destructans 20631-21]OAF55997.1 hypothetical protein VC83_07935 [Pseudogymnoascus destructans]
MWYDVDADRPLMNIFIYSLKESIITKIKPQFRITCTLHVDFNYRHSLAIALMKATTQPDIDLDDESEGEDVPKAYIGGSSGIVADVNPSDPESIDIPGVNVPSTEDIPVEPDGIDIPEANVPNTDNIPVEPGGSDISEENVPNTDNIPVEPETSILQPLSSTAIDVLAGSRVPTIDIILNSAGIMSIQEYTHSRGRIEMYFSTNHTGYFLFACLIAPQLIEPVCDTTNWMMLVQKDRRPFRERSTIVWADMRYGILSTDHGWSPIRRFGVFELMSRRELDEEDIPLDYPAEVQREWTANFMFVLARAVIYMLDLLVFVSISVLVVAGGTRFISLVQGFYRDINRETVFGMRESVRGVYCFLKSISEHWPHAIWFVNIEHAAVGYHLEKCH